MQGAPTPFAPGSGAARPVPADAASDGASREEFSRLAACMQRAGRPFRVCESVRRNDAGAAHALRLLGRPSA
jgi:hypothetical protein